MKRGNRQIIDQPPGLECNSFLARGIATPLKKEHVCKGLPEDDSSTVGAFRVVTGHPDARTTVVSDRAAWMVFANPALEAVAGHNSRL